MNPVSLKTVFARIFDAIDVHDRGIGFVTTAAALAPTASGVGLTVNVAAGPFVCGTAQRRSYVGGSVTMTAGAGSPRVDIIYMTSAGGLAKSDGVAAASNPVPPTWPVGSCPVAIVYVASGATDFLGGSYILDIRNFDPGGPVTNVFRHGAVGDNSTDDAAAFQAAHDALPTSGGSIYVPQPPSKFAIATQVVFTKPTRLFGDGWGSIIRANGSITRIFLFSTSSDGSVVEDMRIEGNKTASGGTILRGVEVNGAKDCMVRNVLFSGPNATTGLNFGVDIVGANSDRTRVVNCRFERLCSSSSNGSSVLIEGANYCLVAFNDVDGTQFNNFDAGAGASIFLSQLVGATGSSYNVIVGNTIHDHPQIGISGGSTSYTQFASQLPQMTGNVVEGNHVYNCGAAGGGDAGSGIIFLGRQTRNIIRDNVVHNCGGASGGYGIGLSGSQRDASVVAITGATNAAPIVVSAAGHAFINGNNIGVQGVLGNTAANGAWVAANVVAGVSFELQGSTGNGAYTGGGIAGLSSTAAYDEAPDNHVIAGNNVYLNKDHGIRLSGATNTTVRDNFGDANGQRTANTFADVNITRVGGTLATGNGNVVTNNHFTTSTQPAYHVQIGAGPVGTVVMGNVMPTAGTNAILDAGTTTVRDFNATSAQAEFAPAREVVGGALSKNTIASAGTTAFAALSINTFGASEQDREQIMATDVVAKNLRLGIATSQPSDGGFLAIFRVNEGTTALLISIPSSGSSGVYSNTSTCLPISAGSRWSIAMRNDSAACLSAQVIGWGVAFDTNPVSVP